MTQGWKLYKNAPADGTVVCDAQDVPEGTAKSVLIGQAPVQFPILIVRREGRMHAYVNACPHQYLPLDYRAAQVLSADGRILRCTNHHAGFCAVTGLGVEGIGIGGHLDPVPVRIDSNDLLVVDDP